MRFYTILLFACGISAEYAAGFGHFGSLPRRKYARPFDLEPETHLEERAIQYKFLTNKTKSFLVTSMPELGSIGEMYSGLIPINENNESRQLFFVFHPKAGDSVEEVTIWLNGGPGCSSLEGFFQENGPWTWQPGTIAPVKNPYPWTNLTNMLWVEQLVGTGFSTGTPTATSQLDIASDFVKFFKNFQITFGIKNFKIYVTGESYAGRYVPYISAAMLDDKNTTYYNLSGAMMYDPCIGEFVSIQEEYTAVPFVKANNNLLNVNDTYLAELERLHQSCGYADYIHKYLQFPPPAHQPPLYFNFTSQADCDVFDDIYTAVLETNTCFNIYRISDMCPILSDVLGFPGSLFQDVYHQVYFNRTDVKKAMHAPLSTNWSECSANPVFVGKGGPQGESDTSPDPIQRVLPQVIEATNRVLVANGDFDMVIITNGTLLAIQNMTWNGKLGFQNAPYQTFTVNLPDIEYEPLLIANGFTDPTYGQGVMGRKNFERGLMWSEVYQSGHMVPQFQGRVAYLQLEWVLGRINTL